MKDKEEETVCNRSVTVKLTIVENRLIYFQAVGSHIQYVVTDVKVHTNLKYLELIAFLVRNEIQRTKLCV